MKLRSKKINLILWIILFIFYGHSIVSAYSTGRTKTFYFYLALIPFFFLCWGLNILLAGKRMRDIARHMTDGERNHITELSMTFGAKLGFIGAPFACVFAMMYMTMGFTHISFYFLLLGVLLAIVLPFGLKHRKQVRNFMESTEYGKHLTANQLPDDTARKLTDP